MGRAAQTISFALLVSSVCPELDSLTVMLVKTLEGILTSGQAYLLLAMPLLTQDSPVPSILPTKIQVEIIPALPFWALISLGAYLLGRLGLGVLRFNDTKEAYTELMGQIDGAKKNLDQRKVRWD
jgi:dolichyl-phosphate mannosyltransferase polypeptide 3